MDGENRAVTKLLALLAAQWWLGRRAIRAMRSFERPALWVKKRAPVSVIVPARNEAKRLGFLLESIQHQLRDEDELVVVDDSSTDSTREVVRKAGVRVVEAGALPSGWLGKSHACWRGAGETSRRWLLYLDADVVLMPGALDRALGHVEQKGLQCLSALGHQRIEGLWEKLLVPFAYRHYFAGHGATATINGQFLLITRRAYEASGGHEAVRGSVAEDVGLSALFRRRSLPFALVDGRGLFSVRMYESLDGIVEGFGKNSSSFLKADLVGGLLTVLSTILAAAPYLALLRGKVIERLAALVALALDVRSARVFEAELTGQPPSAGGFAQWIAQPLFVAIALRSLAGARAGLTWKGRRLP